MNEQEEKYLHFAFCIDSLNSAWRILSEIKKQPKNVLSGFAFQFALIEYSKPYRTSYGVLVNRHKLSDDFVPSQYVELHKRILDLRDRFLAHTDLSIMDANVVIAETQNEKMIVRSQNLIYGTEEMKNIADIIDLIEKTIDSMRNEVKKIEDELRANSDSKI